MKRESNRLLASSLRRMVRANKLTPVRKILAKAHPADVAHVFGSLSAAQRKVVFGELPNLDVASEVLSEVEPAFIDDLLEGLTDDRLADLLRRMAPDDGADLLAHVGEHRKEALISSLSAEEQSEAESLMGYHPESAGGLMSTDYFALSEETNAREAIRLIQEDAGATEVMFYLYALDEHDHLVGVTSLRELVTAPPSSPISAIMNPDVIRVPVEQDQEEVARLVARYNLLALPVVDANNRMVGVVTVDDIIDVIRHEATEDIMKMAGAGEDVSPHQSPFVGFRTRLPWLVPSFFAGILGVVVISSYEAELIALAPLAALIPLIMGMAGNIGVQSSTVVTRWLATGKLEFVQLGRIVGRELTIGLVAGAVYGTLVGVFVALFFASHPAFVDNLPRFAAASGAAVVSAMALSATLGASAPLAFDKLGLDPAMASGPFVTTTIDVGAVWLYLFTAALLLL